MKKTWYWLAGFMILTAINCKGQPDNAGVAEQNPVHLTKADFLRLVMDYERNKDVWVFKGKKPCLIDFYADWCAPCRITSPILEDLAKKYAGRINIYKVDVDKERELAAIFGVQSIPTFLFCPLEGNPTISSGIAGSAEATKNLFIQQIEELLLKTGGPSAI